jgi:hypothetical protein
VFARIRYILNSEEAAMSRSRSLAQAAALSLAVVFGMLALVSTELQAVADPPVATIQPAIPAKVAAPVLTPPVVVPVPVIPATVPTLPLNYTQKPQVIIEGGGSIEVDTPPAQTQPQPEATTARAAGSAKRAWGPEQAEGPPDTEGAGDIQSAWASQTQDGQKEWLVCDYAEPVLPSAVLVHETYNPGTLEKVTVFDEAGTEHEAWTGTDPTPRTAARGTSIIPIKTKFPVQKVKLFFDSPAVAGWNEIDAVGLRSKDDNVQWAMKVTASSTYAQQVEPVPVNVIVPAGQFQRLQQEVNDLKKELERMKQMEADLKELKDLVKSLKDDK